MVVGLKEGGLYRFRVRAVNVAGVGEPGLVTEMIELSDRTSKTECKPSCLSCFRPNVFIYNITTVI